MVRKNKKIVKSKIITKKSPLSGLVKASKKFGMPIEEFKRRGDRERLTKRQKDYEKALENTRKIKEEIYRRIHK